MSPLLKKFFAANVSNAATGGWSNDFFKCASIKIQFLSGFVSSLHIKKANDEATQKPVIKTPLQILTQMQTHKNNKKVIQAHLNNFKQDI